MCLVAFALHAHPDWPLVIAANRDELHARPALPAHDWLAESRNRCDRPAALRHGATGPAGGDDAIAAFIAGRDVRAGGTWLGARRDRDGTLRIAVLTNIRPGLRAPPARDHAAPAARASRGSLVTTLLGWPAGDSSMPDLDAEFGAIAARAGAFDGFNLLGFRQHGSGIPSQAGLPAGSARPGVRAGCLDNLDPHAPRQQTPAPGIHVLSNAVLDVPWFKSRRLGRRLGRLLQAVPAGAAAAADAVDGTPAADAVVGATAPGATAPSAVVPGAVAPDAAPRGGGPPDGLVEGLFRALSDRGRAPPAQLPHTGLPPAREALLSSAFIVDPVYGTRCSTVCVLHADGRCWFEERRFDPDGRETGRSRFVL